MRDFFINLYNQVFQKTLNQNTCTFNVYIQKYYTYKRKSEIWTELRPFPVDVENLMHDTMESLRPKSKLPETYEDACKQVEELENEYKKKICKFQNSVFWFEKGNSCSSFELVTNDINTKQNTIGSC